MQKGFPIIENAFLGACIVASKRLYRLGDHAADIGLAMFVGRGRFALASENRSFVQEPKSLVIGETSGWNLEAVAMSPMANVVSFDTKRI